MEKSMEQARKELNAPFEWKDIELRIGSMTKDKKKAQVLAYVDVRAVQERLDDVFGVNNWRNEYRPWHKLNVIDKDGVVSEVHSQLCGISVRFGDEWVTKYDGADCTDIEPIKGGLSSSMKRTGSVWGIGRYLYDFKMTEWFVLDEYKKILKEDKEKIKGYYEQFVQYGSFKEVFGRNNTQSYNNTQNNNTNTQKGNQYNNNTQKGTQYSNNQNRASAAQPVKEEENKVVEKPKSSKEVFIPIDMNPIKAPDGMLNIVKATVAKKIVDEVAIKQYYQINSYDDLTIEMAGDLLKLLAKKPNK